MIANKGHPRHLAARSRTCYSLHVINPQQKEQAKMNAQSYFNEEFDKAVISFVLIFIVIIVASIIDALTKY